LPGRAYRVFLGLTGQQLSLLCVIFIGIYLGSLYWVATLVATDDKSLTIGLLYRHDLQYAALVESLGRLDFSPTYSTHLVGDGIVVYPIVALLSHAILFKLLGVIGYWVADVIYVTAFFVVGYVLLRQFGIRNGLAVVALIFNVFLALPQRASMTSHLSLPSLLADTSNFSLLEAPSRLPSPLISAPIFLTILLFLKHFLNSKREYR
jgi:hypothetical protein